MESAEGILASSTLDEERELVAPLALISSMIEQTTGLHDNDAVNNVIGRTCAAQNEENNSTRNCKISSSARLPSRNEEHQERSYSPDSTCSICLGGLENKSFTDSCFHAFCFECLVEWSKVG